MNTGSFIGIIVCAFLCIPVSGCAATVGQQFRDIMAEIDAQCRKDKMGPYFDPSDRESRRRRAITDCDILKIKPADPLATEEGRFAYSIKLPPPHDQPKVQYRPGMSAESYFKELCEKEAGEWIFRTVENVEGVFQGRQNIPLSTSGDSALIYHAFEMNEIRFRDMENGLVQPIYGRYNYLERPVDDTKVGTGYVRFFRGAETKQKYPIGYTVNQNGAFRNIPYIVNSEQASDVKSHYGFTWRQILDKSQLEHGIRGGETIIYDLTTKEVLAFRRFFGRAWPRPESRYTRLTNGDYCQPRFSGGVAEFVQKVLVPINPAE